MQCRCSCSKRAGIAVSSKGCFLCSALCMPQTEGRGEHSLLLLRPPLCLLVVCPAPFPGDRGNGGGRGPGYMSHSPCCRSSFCFWASTGVGALLFLQLMAVFELRSVGSCVLAFREAEVSVWGKSFRTSQGSAAYIAESTLLCRSSLVWFFFFFRSVILYWVFRGDKMV